MSHKARKNTGNDCKTVLHHRHNFRAASEAGFTCFVSFGC